MFLKSLCQELSPRTNLGLTWVNLAKLGYTGKNIFFWKKLKFKLWHKGKFRLIGSFGKSSILAKPKFLQKASFGERKI